MRRLFSRHRTFRSAIQACWLVLFCAGLCIPASADVGKGIGGDKKKDRKEKDDGDRNTSYLPEARSLALRFVSGQSITVNLSGSVTGSQQVEFLIRQWPQYGTLSTITPHPTDSSRAVVTYQHHGGETPLADSFTYACRVPGGSWSAPATVTLAGQRMEPRLEVLEHPTFGRTFVGGERTSKIRVRNAGTAPLSMALTWQAPWKGPPTLELPLGGVDEFYITFKPEKPGDYRLDTQLQPGVTTSRVILYGECIFPFTVTPGNLALEFDETTGERGGTISLVNSRDIRVTASLSLPGGLQGPATVDLEPMSKQTVRLWLAAPHVAAFKNRLIIRSGENATGVDVSAKPTPGAIKMVSPGPQGHDFGRVTLKSTFTRDVVIANRGGETLQLEARTTPPFVMETLRDSASIPPGEERTFKVKVSADRLGPVSGKLLLISGREQLSLPLMADVVEPPAPIQSPSADKRIIAPKSVWPPVASEAQPVPVKPAPAPKAGPDSPQSKSGLSNEALRTRAKLILLAHLVTHGMPVPASSINPHLERVGGLTVLDTSSSGMTLEWTKPPVMPAGWAIEYAGMAYLKEYNAFGKIWTRYPNWKPVDAEEGKVAVRLFGLQPDSQYELRVMGLDREGKISEPSRPVVGITPQPWRVPGWVWRVLIVAALSLVGYVLFRVRRGDFMVEA